jgi:hypothetical protein
MASVMVPVFPAGWFVRQRYDTLAKVGRIEAPVLVIHSRDDEMIPFAMAERLFGAAKEPKKLVAFEGAGHNDLAWRRGADLASALAAFLAEVVTSPAGPVRRHEGRPSSRTPPE